jgi:hypothetical protein
MPRVRAYRYVLAQLWRPTEVVSRSKARTVTHARAKEYRRPAEDCLAAVRTVSTQEARAVLIERAQFWFRLAKEQEGDKQE